MGLSKRERMIILTTIVVVGALVGDKFIWPPIADRWGDLKNQRQQLQDQVNKANNLFQLQQQKKPIWDKLLAQGLQSAAEAEGSVAKAIDKWSAGARLSLTSVTPNYMPGDKGLKEIVFIVAGKGSLNAVAWFLYQAETSELPVKVKYMQIGSTSEAGDNMTLELRLSTLYVAADDKSPSRQPRRQGTTNDEQL
jgi:hypothetical protein